MDANAIVFELLHKGIIGGGDKNSITKNEDPTQQNQILHLALKQTCTDEALLTACDVIIMVPGNPNMRTLAENMKKRLTGEYLYLCVCVSLCVLHVCMCAHVQECMP